MGRTAIVKMLSRHKMQQKRLFPKGVIVIIVMLGIGVVASDAANKVGLGP